MIERSVNSLWEWALPLLLVCIVGNDLGSFIFDKGRLDQLVTGSVALALLILYFRKTTPESWILARCFAWAIGFAIFVGVGIATRSGFDFVNLLSIGVVLTSFVVNLQD